MSYSRPLPLRHREVINILKSLNLPPIEAGMCLGINGVISDALIIGEFKEINKRFELITQLVEFFPTLLHWYASSKQKEHFIISSSFYTASSKATVLDMVKNNQHKNSYIFTNNPLEVFYISSDNKPERLKVDDSQLKQITQALAFPLETKEIKDKSIQHVRLIQSDTNHVRYRIRDINIKNGIINKAVEQAVNEMKKSDKDSSKYKKYNEIFDLWIFFQNIYIKFFSLNLISESGPLDRIIDKRQRDLMDILMISEEKLKKEGLPLTFSKKLSELGGMATIYSKPFSNSGYHEELQRYLQKIVHIVNEVKDEPKKIALQITMDDKHIATLGFIEGDILLIDSNNLLYKKIPLPELAKQVRASFPKEYRGMNIDIQTNAKDQALYSEAFNSHAKELEDFRTSFIKKQGWTYEMFAAYRGDKNLFRRIYENNINCYDKKKQDTSISIAVEKEEWFILLMIALSVKSSENLKESDVELIKQHKKELTDIFLKENRFFIKNKTPLSVKWLNEIIDITDPQIHSVFEKNDIHIDEAKPKQKNG
jgi:hypothetical protein